MKSYVIVNFKYENKNISLKILTENICKDLKHRCWCTKSISRIHKKRVKFLILGDLNEQDQYTTESLTVIVGKIETIIQDVDYKKSWIKYKN